MKENQHKVRDKDQSQIGKLEQQIRYFQEQQSFSTQEMTIKLKNLEEQVILGDHTRQQLRDKLNQAEESNREMVSFIKSLQN